MRNDLTAVFVILNTAVAFEAAGNNNIFLKKNLIFKQMHEKQSPSPNALQQHNTQSVCLFIV